jgi:catechol 2,3-dioxygenase-like lactoylglutathione lyase family enzyme
MAVSGRLGRPTDAGPCRHGVLVKLTFVYQPVQDVEDAVAFYRDHLGFEEAWRDSDVTVAFWLPGRPAQIMVSTTKQPPGPMYLVDSLAAWIDDHPGITTTIEKYEIPGGSVAGFEAPGGSTFYVFDQPKA